VTYAIDNNVKIAFGSDINGFTNQLGPRGPQGRRPAKVSSEYWKHGLRHIGLLPDLAADLTVLKTPGGKKLVDSAEQFMKSWERTWVRVGSLPAKKSSASSTKTAKVTKRKKTAKVAKSKQTVKKT